MICSAVMKKDGACIVYEEGEIAMKRNGEMTQKKLIQFIAFFSGSIRAHAAIQ